MLAPFICCSDLCTKYPIYFYLDGLFYPYNDLLTGSGPIIKYENLSEVQFHSVVPDCGLIPSYECDYSVKINVNIIFRCIFLYDKPPAGFTGIIGNHGGLSEINGQDLYDFFTANFEENILITYEDIINFKSSSNSDKLSDLISSFIDPIIEEKVTSPILSFYSSNSFFDYPNREGSLVEYVRPYSLHYPYLKTFSVFSSYRDFPTSYAFYNAQRTCSLLDIKQISRIF